MSKQQEEIFRGLMVCFKYDSEWEQFSWKPLRTVPKLIVKSSREKEQIENQLKEQVEKKLTKMLPILSATEFFRRGCTSVLNNSIEIVIGYLVTVQLLKKTCFGECNG